MIIVIDTDIIAANCRPLSFSVIILKVQKLQIF